MRSLFWRIFASFWLAAALIALLSLLIGRALNQDAWIIARHQALKSLPEEWLSVFNRQGPEAAQELLVQIKRRFRVDIQVFDEDGEALLPGTFSPRARALEEKRSGRRSLPWRRLTQEYSAPDGESYLFVYRIPHTEVSALHGGMLWLLPALLSALLVLALVSLLLTLSITHPLGKLRRAVYDLGRTAYQQGSLAKLGKRRDELGTLARDFNRMGQRLQNLIDSQRQLLRDVSHELRSPLARLRIALALAERAEEEKRAALWPRLTQECDRLETLIAEILALARLDADPGEAQPLDLVALLQDLCDDAQLAAPEQRIAISGKDVIVPGWKDLLSRALDNLLRNALRFNPAGQPIEIALSEENGMAKVSIRDHGEGIAAQYLANLGEPFFRAPAQEGPGHGLGLAIARRAAQRHGGRLHFANHPQGGFVATLELPLVPGSPFTKY